MARQRVEQVRCDRCKRVELQTVPDAPKTEPDFKAKFLELELVYEDLCVSCAGVLRNAWKDLLEWHRPLQQQFGPKVDGNTAPPMNPAPDYTPPKPHSGGKR